MTYLITKRFKIKRKKFEFLICSQKIFAVGIGFEKWLFAIFIGCFTISISYIKDV